MSHRALVLAMPRGDERRRFQRQVYVLETRSRYTCDCARPFFERVENEPYREFLHDPNVEVYRSRSGGRASADSSKLLPITAGVSVAGLGDVYQAKLIWSASTKSNRRGGSLPYAADGAADATLVAQKIASAVHAIVDSVVAARASTER